ncbi:MAG TPA: hypothetical protein PLB54_01080, partial [Nitrosomonas sp.]|nr:hypothetical protein [Nitrosomonas sp.]
SIEYVINNSDEQRKTDAFNYCICCIYIERDRKRVLDSTSHCNTIQIFSVGDRKFNVFLALI